MNLKDKFAGAILGCAVGDALGAPFEFMKGSAVRAAENLAGQYHKIRQLPARAIYR